MYDISKQILHLLKQKCEQDLHCDPVRPTIPIGYDIPTLQIELDKLYGIGKITFKEIEEALSELIERNEVKKLPTSYILSSYYHY